MRLGMFEVHCDDLIRSLAKRAEALCQKLLGKMSEDHKEANKKWVCDAECNKLTAKIEIKFSDF